MNVFHTPRTYTHPWRNYYITENYGYLVTYLYKKVLLFMWSWYHSYKQCQHLTARIDGSSSALPHCTCPVVILIRYFPGSFPDPYFVCSSGSAGYRS